MTERPKHTPKYTPDDTPDYTVDVRGTISPFSLLKVSLVFQQMKPSQIMEILGCDAEMRQDLMRLLPDAAWEPEVLGTSLKAPEMSPEMGPEMTPEMTTIRLKKQDR